MKLINTFISLFIHFLFLSANYFTIHFLIPHHYSLLNLYTRFTIALLQIILILALISYNQAYFRDPGFMIPQVKAPLCEKCSLPKPKRAHHCRQCNKCVYRMDHHCLWIANCIGIKNQKFFILFLFYSFLYTTLITIIHAFIFCHWVLTVPPDQLKLTKIRLSVMLYVRIMIFFLALFFFCFTLEFLYYQYLCIKLNQTKVEEKKKVLGKEITLKQNLFQIMGTNSFFWMLPISPKLEIDYHEEVHDYNE